ncbi:MAG TPA: TAXI family TRAP transporter solute-binding subunit [Candidatus Cloacimonadota bacterium]|nr:TAXI family TRAP transporter solute-binding subunit [Candidatus Cloacimonadota bacterium]
MKRIGIIISLLLAVCWQTEAATLRIATGNRDGVYFRLGKTLEKLLEAADEHLDLVVLETSGSNENAELLYRGEADLAFMQNDVAYNFCHRENKLPENGKELQGLISLYSEVIQIVGKKSLFIQEMEDLRGEPVAVGELQSGTIRNAYDILRASNLKDRDIIPQYLPFSEIRNAFLQNEISAAFITAGLKVDLLQDLSPSVNFIPLEKETLLSLREKCPYFVATTIPANTYIGQTEPVNAVAVRALLVTAAEIDPALTEQICHVIFHNKSELKKAHPIAGQIKVSSSRRGMSIELHRGAEKYYQKSTIIGILTAILIILLLVLLMIRFKHFVHKIGKSVMRHLRQNIQFRLGCVIVLLFILGTIGTYYFEHSANEQFDTIYKAFWATIVYLLSGFDIEPFTTGGRISAFLLLIGGMGILGTVVGNIASIFMKEGVEKMPKNVKRHIAICNWNKRGETIIEELHHPSAEPDTEILVLTDSDLNEKELRENSNRYANVYFIKGKPTSYKTLKDARIHLAKSIIILSPAEDKEPDPKTILTCLAIRQLQKDLQENHAPHIIAELMDRTNRQIALDAGADEIVSAGFYRTGIMLQSARYHNLSDIFHELLIYEDHTSSIYIIDSDKLPPALEGKTFREAVDIFNRSRDDKNPVILIGVRRNCHANDGSREKAHVILNPRENEVCPNGTFEKFEKGDALVVIAQSYPDLSHIK